MDHHVAGGGILLVNVMRALITLTPTTFLKYRQISDNAVIVKEVMNQLAKKKVLDHYMALKIDLNKAFDQVEWGFINKMLENLGFSKIWCFLMKCCYSSSFIKFILNGTPSGHITPTRGLRQGDPLSPFLCLICT